MKHKRKFVQFSRAWYGFNKLLLKNRADEVYVQLYSADDEFIDEFTVTWLKLNDKKVAELQVLSESWKILYHHFQDLLKEMTEIDSKFITPDEFCQLLLKLGIEDATPTENSHKK